MAVKSRDRYADFEGEAYYSYGAESGEVDSILSWYVRPHARVLDLGCGTGHHAGRFAKLGHHVTGLDISEASIESARERAGDMEGVVFDVADLEKTDISRYGIFDLVVSLGNTMSHLSRPRLAELFDMVRRALSPGGVFVFNAMYWASPFQRNEIYREDDGEISVVWERSLNEEKGTVLLKGHHLKEDLTRTMELQCYKAPEMINLLRLGGFTSIKWSDNIGFRGKNLRNAASLYYKTVHNLRGQFKRA